MYLSLSSITFLAEFLLVLATVSSPPLFTSLRSSPRTTGALSWWWVVWDGSDGEFSEMSLMVICLWCLSWWVVCDDNCDSELSVSVVIFVMVSCNSLKSIILHPCCTCWWWALTVWIFHQVETVFCHKANFKFRIKSNISKQISGGNCLSFPGPDSCLPAWGPHALAEHGAYELPIVID